MQISDQICRWHKAGTITESNQGWAMQNQKQKPWQSCGIHLSSVNVTHGGGDALPYTLWSWLCRMLLGGAGSPAGSRVLPPHLFHLQPDARGSQWEQKQPHQSKAPKQATLLWFAVVQVTQVTARHGVCSSNMWPSKSSPVRPLPRDTDSRDMRGSTAQQCAWCLPSSWPLRNGAVMWEPQKWWGNRRKCLQMEGWRSLASL